MMVNVEYLNCFITDGKTVDLFARVVGISCYINAKSFFQAAYSFLNLNIKGLIILFTMYVPYESRKKQYYPRSRSPEEGSFRTSFKSNQDLSFLKSKDDSSNNDLKVRETLNKPDLTKFSSQTAKPNERPSHGFFKSETEQKGPFESTHNDWGRSNEKRDGQTMHNNFTIYGEQKTMAENIKPEAVNTNSNQYQKLHDKINYLENKIFEMKNNLEKKRQEKKRYFEKQIKEREKITEKDYKAPKDSKPDPLKEMVSQVSYKKNLKPFAFDPYSPRHNIYYVSEVVRAYKQQNSLAREHLVNSIQLLKVLSRSRMPSKDEMSNRAVKLIKRQIHQDKKTVVFDLDETLIHCNENANLPCDIKLPIKFPTGEIIFAGINIRPHAIELLKELSKNFEIIVFTASHSCYANVVLNYLDPQNKYISHRLFREHCYYTNQNFHVKDLRVMNRDLSQTVLIDNAAYSYAFQVDNGIPIIPYYEGKVDYELKALQGYLESLIFVKDVRQVNRNTFKLNRYVQFDNPESLIKQLYSEQLK